MSLEPGFRSIKTEIMIYSPLLIEVHCKDNSSSCPGFGGKKCIICGKIFYKNISTKEEIEHTNTHTDVEIVKILTSNNTCIDKIKSTSMEVGK